MAGLTDEFGLTEKQRKFAENVVSGNSLADAYRNAYDCSNMKPATIQRNAVALMADNRVSTRVEVLAAERRRQSEAVTVSDRDMLVTLLRKWSRGDESATSSQLRAAELLGKACGLYRDVIEDHRERPTELIVAELEARLTALLPSTADADADDEGDGDSAGSDPASSGDEGSTLQ